MFILFGLAACLLTAWVLRARVVRAAFDQEQEALVRRNMLVAARALERRGR
jgi:hypothetical protein